MRVGHRYLGWGSESDQWLPVIDALKRYQLPFDHLHDPACVISSHQHQIEFTLFEDQPGWQEVKILSDTLDLLCQSAVYYSKADHKAAKHFVIHVPEVLYPQPSQHQDTFMPASIVNITVPRVGWRRLRSDLCVSINYQGLGKDPSGVSSGSSR